MTRSGGSWTPSFNKMAGANYMGGKRNAAKARSKDATGRVQKVFFGRQRLHALTKGLRTQTSPNIYGQSQPADRARSQIDLAHAKRDMQTTGSYTVPATPQPRSYYASRQTSSESRTNRSSDSSRTKSSKVLAVLDTSEPLSMRAEMNRILSFPDLAGLTQRDHASSASRVMASKRSQLSISDDSCDNRKRKRARYYDSSVTLGSSDSDLDTPFLLNTQQLKEHSLLLSPLKMSAFKYAHTIQEPLSLVPDYATTLSSIADDIEVIRPREQSYTQDHQNNHANKSFESVQMDTSITNDDSGYAEFEAELQSRTQHPLRDQDSDAEMMEEQDITNQMYTRGYGSQRRPLYQRDSSILCLDTSPPPGSSAAFEHIANYSQLSTSSSLESYLPNFSAMAPQPLNPNSQPMTPFVFRKNSVRRIDHLVNTDIDVPPSSAAEPPPPTFCLPSPTQDIGVSVSSKSQTTWSRVPSPKLGSTHVRSPSLSPAPFKPDPDVVIKINLLDQDDPWDAIGRLLNLNSTSSLTTPQSSAPTRYQTTELLGISMNDRSGVGYVAPQVKEKYEQNARRDIGIHSEALERTTSEEYIDHSSPLSHIQISPPPPVLMMNATLATQPSLSLFLSTILSTESEKADNGGDIACTEPKLSVEERAWLAFSDDERTGSGDNLHRLLESDASAPAVDSSPIPIPPAPFTPMPVKTQYFQGPCLFFDLEEEE